jgi:hypothetical protein
VNGLPIDCQVECTIEPFVDRESPYLLDSIINRIELWTVVEEGEGGEDTYPLIKYSGAKRGGMYSGVPSFSSHITFHH